MKNSANQTVRELSRKTILKFFEEFKKEIQIKKEFIFSNKVIDDVINFKRGLRAEMDGLFQNEGNLNIIDCHNQLLQSKDKFDFIICELPLAMGAKVRFSSFRIYRSWSMLSDALDKLSDDGFLFWFVEPAITFSILGKRFLSELEQKHCYVSAIINTSPGYRRDCMVRPIITIFTKKNTEKLFISELNLFPPLEQKIPSKVPIVNNIKMLKIDDNRINNTITNFFKKKSSNLENGLWIEKESFRTFNNLRVIMQYKKLISHSKEVYNEHKLSDIAKIISGSSSSKKQFIKNENAIYLSKYTPNTYSSLEEIKKKKYNLSSYIQIIVDSNKLLPNYLILFYTTKLGKLLLESYKIGTAQQYIDIKYFKENATVFIPKKSKQEKVVFAYEKMSEIENKISNYKLEISNSPNSVHNILEIIDNIEGPLNLMSEEEKILNLIRKGESINLELKSSFFKDIKTGERNKEMPKTALKNIVAFLNTNGGTLLIGVKDDGEILGIKNDFFISKDNYKNNFVSYLKDNIGIHITKHVQFEIFNVLDKLILKVECEMSPRAVFLNNKEFYLRTNPSCIKLEGPKLQEYINYRFSQ